MLMLYVLCARYDHMAKVYILAVRSDIRYMDAIYDYMGWVYVLAFRVSDIWMIHTHTHTYIIIFAVSSQSCVQLALLQNI